MLTTPATATLMIPSTISTATVGVFFSAKPTDVWPLSGIKMAVALTTAAT